MTVRLESGIIILSGVCGVEEVETLVKHLEENPEFTVNIGAATAIHTALWQALMVFRPQIIGTTMSSVMADTLLPALHALIDKSRQP